MYKSNWRIEKEKKQEELRQLRKKKAEVAAATVAFLFVTYVVVTSPIWNFQ